MADLDDMMGIPEDEESTPNGDASEKPKANPFGFLKNLKVPPTVLKLLLKIVVIVVVIAIQAGASFFIVTKVVAPFNPEEVTQDNTVATDSLLAGTAASNQDVDSTDIDENSEIEISEEPNKNIALIPEPDLNQTNVPPKVVGSIFTLGDVVVNPAMSQGRRFFIVTAVMIFEEKKIDALATEREPILRDGFIRIMSRKSTVWLSSYSNQDILKKELMAYTKQVLEYPGDFYMAFTKYVLQ